MQSATQANVISVGIRAKPPLTAVRAYYMSKHSQNVKK